MKFRGTMAAILSATMLCTAVLAASANTLTPAAPQDAPAATEQQAQLSVLGGKMKVVEVNLKSGGYPSIGVVPADDADAGRESGGLALQLNLGGDTVCIDTKTGVAANAGDIKVGDEIYAYYSAAMTRSLPPQSYCYALVVNLDEKAAPAHYLTAEEVTKNDDGSVTVLAENGTILVTIGKDTPVSPYLTKNIVKNTDIEVGTRFFAWYDQVALSMPGQAHATQAVLLPDAADATDAAAAAETRDGGAAQPLQPGETAPYRFETEATVTALNREVREGDMIIVSSVTVKTADGKELVLHIGDDTLFIDTATGAPANLAELEEGTKVYAYYGDTMTASAPAQVDAEAILVNLDEKHAPAHLLTAERATVNPDGSVTLLAENGGILVTVPADAPVAPYLTKNIVKNTDIRMGVRVLAWYDVVAESYPAQATATKAVLLPAQDRELTMISEGDIAIGKAKVENGIVMVPLRQVAEKLGFKVTWDDVTESVHLIDSTRQMTVKLGVDSYAYSAVQAGLDMSNPSSLGAAAYEAEGTTWAPAELFNLLVEGSPVRLNDDVLYI